MPDADTLCAKALLQALPLPMLCLDPADGFRVVFANPAAAAHFGLTVGALRQSRPTDWDPATPAATLADRWLAAEGRVHRFQTTHRHANGAWTPVEVTAVTLTCDGRQLVHATIRAVESAQHVEAMLAEGQLGSVLDNLKSVVYRCRNDETWTLLWISGGCRELLGHAPEDLIGNRTVALGDLIHADDAPALAEKCQRNLAARLPCSNEYRVRTATGAEKWVWDQAQGVYSDRGELLYIDGILSDITVRKQSEQRANAAEAALRRSERWFRALLERSVDAVAVFAADGRALYHSPSAEQITGYGHDELMAGRGLCFTHPDDADAAAAAFAALAANPGGTAPVSFRLRHRSGRAVWIEGVGRNHLADPDIQGIVCNYRDATHRVLAERALRESEERLRLALASANQGIYDLNLITGEAVVTPEYARMLGFEPAEFHETNAAWLDRLHPDERDAVGQAYADYVAGRRPDYRVEFRQRTRSGEWLWILSIGRIVERTPDGRPLRMLGTHTDITARRTAEQAQATLQAQLAQAQRMESVGRLAGGVAHDFNNMLTVISGRTQLALARLTPDHRDASLREDLQEIADAATRSAAMTRQLLAFSRRQPAAPRVIDLNRTIATMLAMLRRLLGEGIQLDWRPGADLWPVCIDPNQVDQVLANLLLNARDALAGEGTITIVTANAPGRLQLRPGDEHQARGDCVVLTVADHGCGIAKDDLAHVFEPFFTTKEHGRGTGLGLATVWGIVRQNGGTIDVDSEPGEGSTFRICLARAGSPAADDEGPADDATLRGNGETILLVEDEPSILAVARQMLQGLGYRVLVADSPAKALQCADRHPDPIDLLITDVVMPGMNGLELADQLTASRPQLQCVYVSGYPEAVVAEGGLLRPGLHFLQKPFGRAELAASIRDAIARRR